MPNGNGTGGERDTLLLVGRSGNELKKKKPTTEVKLLSPAGDANQSENNTDVYVCLLLELCVWPKKKFLCVS